MKKALVLLIVVLGMAGAASASADSPADEAGENGSSASGTTTYVVQYRDSVEKVARQFGVTVEEIISVNPHAVSRRPICVDERAWTLRSGTVVTTCRRTEHWFRRAGMTITIPVSRTILEAETVRLNSELAALRMELGLVRQERESARQERNAAEHLYAELALKTSESESRHDEPEQKADTNPSSAAPAASCPAKTNHAPDEVRDDDNTTTIFIITLLLAVGVIVYQHFRPSKRTRQLAKQVQAEQAQVTRERTELEATRKKVAREAREVAEARRKLDEEKLELEAARQELEKQREVAVAVLSRRETVVGQREEDAAKAKRSSGPPPIFPPNGPKVQADRAEAPFIHVLIARGRKLLEDQARELAGREETVRGREAGVADQEEVLRRREADVVAREESLVERIEAVRQEGAAAKVAELVAAQAEFGRKAEELSALADRLEEKRVLLEGWETRLSLRSAEDDEDPTSVDGRMGGPPSLPGPDENSITSISLAAQMLVRQVESVDIEGEVHFEIPGRNNSPGSADADKAAGEDRTSVEEPITCSVCGEEFPDRRRFNDHREVRPDCRHATPHTPTLRPPAGKPAARIGSRPTFYCAVCGRDVQMDERDTHNEAHRAEKTLGPLPPPKGEEK
jgi:hypothetical protein